MVKDREEAIIKAEYENMRTPRFDILKGVKMRMGRKKHVFSRKIFVATCAIMCLFFATVVAAQGISRFNRLEYIVGEEMAELISPISYEYADYSFITDNGIKIWMVATGVHDNVIDIFIMMQDLEGDRLGNRVYVDYSIISYYGAPVPELGTTGAPAPFSNTNLANWSRTQMETIDRDSNGVITLRARETFSEPIDVYSITLVINEIFYDIREYYEWELPVDFNNIDRDPPAIFIEAEREGERLTVLAPRQLELIPMAGLERGISSIGIIDGNLHVQFYEVRDPSRRLTRLNTIAYMYLVNPYGDKHEAFAGTLFNMIADGYAYWSPERDCFESTYYFYHEQIFEVDLARISEYRLLGNFRTFESVALDWQVVLDVEISGQQWIKSDIHIVTDLLTINELRITPVSLMVIGLDPYFDKETMPRYSGGTRWGLYSVLGSEWAISIHTEQGIVPVYNEMHTREGAQLTLVYHFDNSEVFLALCSIISIEIAGEMVTIAVE